MDGGLVVAVSQQELAAAAGTVREVVVRELRQLRESGAVQTERDRIIILDSALLTRELGSDSNSGRAGAALPGPRPDQRLGCECGPRPASSRGRFAPA